MVFNHIQFPTSRCVERKLSLRKNLPPRSASKSRIVYYMDEEIEIARHEPNVQKIDFRFLDEGIGGEAKRKRAFSAAEDSSSKRIALDMEIDEPTSQKDPETLQNDVVTIGKVSGRNWKEPKPSRSSSLRVRKNIPSLDQRNAAREKKKIYKEKMAELKESIRMSKVEKRKAAEERKKKKEENTLRTGSKLQIISNPKTLKKLSKAQKKKLHVVNT